MLKNFVHSVVSFVKDSNKKESVPEESVPEFDYLIFVPIPGGGPLNDFVPTVSTLVRARVNRPNELHRLWGYHFRVELDKDFVIFAPNQDYALGAFADNLSILVRKGRFETLTVKGTPIRSVPEPFASKVRRVFDKEAYLL